MTNIYTRACDVFSLIKGDSKSMIQNQSSPKSGLAMQTTRKRDYLDDISKYCLGMVRGAVIPTEEELGLLGSLNLY